MKNKILSEIISKMPFSDFKDSTVRNLLLPGFFHFVLTSIGWTEKWKSFKQLLWNKTWRQPWVRWCGESGPFPEQFDFFFLIRACETGAICSDGGRSLFWRTEWDTADTKQKAMQRVLTYFPPYSWQQKITKKCGCFSPPSNKINPPSGYFVGTQTLIPQTFGVKIA